MAYKFNVGDIVISKNGKHPLEVITLPRWDGGTWGLRYLHNNKLNYVDNWNINENYSLYETSETIMNTEIISTIKVSRSIYYYPYGYLEYCEECNTTPTQEGFVDFIRPKIYDWIDDEFIREMVTIEHLNKDT